MNFQHESDCSQFVLLQNSGFLFEIVGLIGTSHTIDGNGTIDNFGKISYIHDDIGNIVIVRFFVL